mgnify:FL=1
MYLLDTNIFLEILLEQKRSEECEALLKGIKNSRILFYVSSFTLHSIEVAMIRENKIELLSDFLKFILTSKLIRLDTNTSEELQILNLAKEFELDFDDAFQFYLCRRNNLKIISFDKHFDKLTIERVEPKDVDI